jgi:hypothetical protein
MNDGEDVDFWAGTVRLGGGDNKKKNKKKNHFFLVFTT